MRNAWGRRLPLRFQLALLCGALALPILAFVGFILWQFAAAERSREELEAIDFAHATAVAVDRELTGLTATLEVLAYSPLLQSDDLEGFHRLVTDLERRQGLTFVLRSPDGQQLVNVRRPFGAALPKAPIAADAIAIATKRPTVSDLFVEADPHAPLFAVVAPVLRDGEVAYLLGLSLDAARIRNVLMQERPPEGWTVSVVDGNGVFLARNIRHEDFVGKPASKDLLESTRGRREGSWLGFAVDGEYVFGAFARSRLADWRVAVGVRNADLSAPLRRSLWTLAGLGAGLALLSTLLAVFFGRRITEPMEALARQAAALGRGEAVQPVATALSEVADVGEALSVASIKILSDRTEQEKAAETIRDLNARLETRVAERTRELAAANERLVAEAASRERAEEQLRQAQKMETVGRLTGGVAHDFNNLLTVVLGSLEMLRRRVGEHAEPRVLHLVDQAIEGANRAATLTYRLLAFSRQHPLAPEPVDANRLVASMSDLLRRTIGEDIEIETVLAGGLWATHADPNQLENALLNLAVNAKDSMPDGGKLTIETANASLDKSYAAAKPDVSAGQYVMIAMGDTGAGMAREVSARAFEPFFTTKPVGKGTGLGLSQVYGFAKQSGGHAVIHSEPESGTTVKIYLPRFKQTDADEVTAATGVGRAAADAEGAAAGPRTPVRQTVLVVEDEAMVRALSIAALEEAGYEVLSAADGPSGLALLAAHPEVALLFSDVVLPGPLSGRKVADEALRRRPELKVLFTTGYARDAIVHHGRLDEDVELITKPFTASLVEKVRRVLDRGE